MTLRSRIGGMVMGLSLVGALGILPSLAQEPKDKADASAAKSARRVPPYFSKVGLTPEQKEKVYTIRGKHQARIEELKRQIDEAQAKEMEECEAVLLDSQKKMLQQFRAEAKANAETKAKSKAKAKADAAKGSDD